MLKKYLFLLILVFLYIACTGCNNVIPVFPTSTSSVYISKTPDVIINHPDLEVISPENIMELTKIAEWGQGKIIDVAVSPNKQTIAVSTRSGITLYDSLSLNEIRFIEKEITDSSKVSFSPDGDYLAFSHGRRVSLLNLSTYEIEKSFWSAVSKLDIGNIQVSHDNNHVILFTHGPYLQCDAYGYNFALYDLSHKNPQLVYDQYFCGPSNSISRFTENGKAYFFYWDAVNPLPYGMNSVDLSSNQLVESVFYSGIDYDPHKTFYDISSDGQTLASLEYKGGEHITRFVDSKINEVTQIVEGQISFSEFSQEGDLVWQDKRRRSTLTDQSCQIIENSNDSYKKVNSSGDLSTYIIYHDYSPQILELWDTSECNILKEVETVSTKRAVFSPDGQLLATQNGYNLDVWDVKTGQIRFSATGTKFRFPINVFVFSDNSEFLIIGTYEEKGSNSPQSYMTYSFAVWDTQTGNLIRIIETDRDFLRDIVTGSSSGIVAVSDLSGVNFWNITSGELLATLPPGNFEFTSSGNSAWLVHGEEESTQSITLFDILTGERIKEFQTNYYYIEELALFEDDSRMGLVVLNNERNFRGIVIIDADTGAELYKAQLDRDSREFISNGTLFATYGSKGLIDIWDYQSASPLRRIYGFHTIDIDGDTWSVNNIDYLEFAPRNDFLISFRSPPEFGYPDSVRFWDIQTGNLLGEVEPNFVIDSYLENTITISPDGQLIVITGIDGIMRLLGVPNND